MTDVPNGLKHFVRTPMATSMDADFDTGNARYKARERYSFEYRTPWASLVRPVRAKFLYESYEGPSGPLLFVCANKLRGV